MANTTWEYRGVRNLQLAYVIEDSKERYRAIKIGQLAPVATISKETASNTKTSYYDNLPGVVITSTGSDTFQITTSVLELERLAAIANQTYDAETGALIEGERDDRYWAIGYEYDGTDGRRRFSWRYKGQFQLGTEQYNTKDDGTDTSNMQLTFTSIATTYAFEKTGKGVKGIVVDDTSELLDYETFLDDVVTPDDLVPVSSGGILPPEFLPSSSKFTNTLHVTLASPTTNVSIKYTTDGTNPKSSATAQNYDPSTGINISATTTIMAYAYAGGSMAEPSEVSMKTYTKV